MGAPVPPVVALAAAILGVDPGKDADVLWVAEDMALGSLPDGWVAYTDPRSGQQFYNNTASGESVWEHPLLPFYRGAIFMAQGGMQRLQTNEAARPPTQAEVTAMGEYLEISAGEPGPVQEVASLAVSAPLPPGWAEIKDADGEDAFRWLETGAVQSEHPLDPYFVELLRRRRIEAREADGMKAPVESVAARQHMQSRQLPIGGQDVCTPHGPVPPPPRAGVESSAHAPPDTALVQRDIGTSASCNTVSTIDAGLYEETRPGSQVRITRDPVSVQIFDVEGGSERGTPLGHGWGGGAGGALMAPSQPAPAEERPPTEEERRAAEKEERKREREARREARRKREEDAFRKAAAEGLSREQWEQRELRKARDEAQRRLQNRAAAKAGAAWGAARAGDGDGGERAAEAGAAAVAARVFGAELAPDEATGRRREEHFGPEATALGEGGGGGEIQTAPPASGEGIVRAAGAGARADAGGAPPGESKGEMEARIRREVEAQVRLKIEEERIRKRVEDEVRAKMGAAGHAPSPPSRRSGTPPAARLRGGGGGGHDEEGNDEDEIAKLESRLHNIEEAGLSPQGRYSRGQVALPGALAQAPPEWGGGGGRAGAPGSGGRSRAIRAEGNTYIHSSPQRSAVGPGAGGGGDTLLSPGGEHGMPGAVSLSRRERAADEAITVVVRARPLERKQKPAWRVTPEEGSIAIANAAALRRSTAFFGPDGNVRASTASGDNPGHFRFDAVFGEGATTSEIYSGHLRRIVGSALEGINGTIFAYGQTGSGKTFTIVGNKSSPGVVPMAVADVFDRVRGDAGCDYAIRVGMLEIYNEELKDLLAPPGSSLSAARLQVKEDPEFGVVVAGMSEEVVTEQERVRKLIDRGNTRRQTGATKMNEESSRSHTIVRMVIESRDKSDPDGAVKVSTLSFVDLAGSERLNKSGAEGIRKEEATNINLSLLQLGNVISKLAEGGRGDFIPYRNSKLTRILQPSLGGNARTAIIATVSAASAHAEETSHTLRFASRAQRVTNRVQVNEVLSDEALLKRYRLEIEELKKQLAQAESGLPPEHRGHAADVSALEALEAQVQEIERENEALRGRIEGLQHDGPISPGGGKPPSKMGKGGGAAMDDKSLAAFARAAGVGRVGAGGGRGADSHELVLNAVRALRAERDDLRARHRKAADHRDDVRGKLEHEAFLAAERPLLEAATSQLEAALGAGPGPGGLPDRLAGAVGGAVVVSAELASLTRQHAEVSGLYRIQLELVGGLREELEAQRGRLDSTSRLEKEAAMLRDELAIANKLLGRPEPAPGGAATGTRAAALAYVEGVEKRLETKERIIKAVEKERDHYKERAESGVPAGAAGSEVGAPAVRTALEASRRVRQLELAVEESATRAERLQRDLDAARGPGGAGPEGEPAHPGESAERYKARLYGVSRELSIVQRERDELARRLREAGGDTFVPLAVHQASRSPTRPGAGTGGASARTHRSGADGVDPSMGGRFDYGVVAMEAAGRIPADPGAPWAPPETHRSAGSALKSDRSGRRRKAAADTPAKEWTTDIGGDKNSKDAEIVKLRKRLVALEKERAETVARCAAQVRAAQVAGAEGVKAGEVARKLQAQLQALEHNSVHMRTQRDTLADRLQQAEEEILRIRNLSSGA